jgi:hypothetical protein
VGGLEADFGDICAVAERLASGCLTTTFVWVQHLGAVFDDDAVPAERVTSVGAYEEGPPPPALVRIHAALPLGVVRRCRALLGPTPLDVELEALRDELDQLDPDTIGASRAAAGELALRAAGALAVETGSRSLLLSEHAQRLAREALFCLVSALRPDAREAALRRLTRGERRDGPGTGAAGSHAP